MSLDCVGLLLGILLGLTRNEGVFVVGNKVTESEERILGMGSSLGIILMYEAVGSAVRSKVDIKLGSNVVEVGNAEGIKLGLPEGDAVEGVGIVVVEVGKALGPPLGMHEGSISGAKLGIREWIPSSNDNVGPLDGLSDGCIELVCVVG